MNDLLNIENKILIIRGQHVMLDRDLAEIYGYETKNFNRQVKNNIEKFDDDFMFQLTHTEVEELSRCNFFTPIMPEYFKGLNLLRTTKLKQIFDAYIAFQGLIQKARKEIILIDNYIDLSVLERLSHQ